MNETFKQGQIQCDQQLAFENNHLQQSHLQQQSINSHPILNCWKQLDLKLVIRIRFDFVWSTIGIIFIIVLSIALPILLGILEVGYKSKIFGFTSSFLIIFIFTFIVIFIDKKLKKKLVNLVLNYNERYANRKIFLRFYKKKKSSFNFQGKNLFPSSSIKN
ncbi:hypothetical protein ACTFIU_008865 [Dictyostelium citrinum]